MVAALLKIVTTGMQDERLQPPKDQPDIGAFLTVMIKAGRYGTQWSRIDFDTKPELGSTSIIRIPVQGELVSRIFLVTQMPDIYTPQKAAQATQGFLGPKFGWTNSLGHALINRASLTIGGNLVDTIPGNLMEVLDEFQTPLERVCSLNKLLCRKDNGFNEQSFGMSSTSQRVVTPLPFWFSRGDPGCLLPIDALYVDEVRLTIQYNPITSLYYTDTRVPATTATTSTSPGIPRGSLLTPILGAPFYMNEQSSDIQDTLGRVIPIPGIKMPSVLPLVESYLLVEYVYLDKAEANRFRVADIQVPVVQHYSFDPVDSLQNSSVRIPLVIPNPTRDIFFYCQRFEAQGYNAPFLATRDLSNVVSPVAPWWPDATGLDARLYVDTLRPGFSRSDSEPIDWLAFIYEETLIRYSTENVALFRSLIPSIEQRKAPWINRYFYNLPFGSQNGFTPFSLPVGEANHDKIQRAQLALGFRKKTGSLMSHYVDRFQVYVFAETYNIFRVYGGRGAMMFAY